jgi:hypothetical protein
VRLHLIGENLSCCPTSSAACGCLPTCASRAARRRAGGSRARSSSRRSSTTASSGTPRRRGQGPVKQAAAAEAPPGPGPGGRLPDPGGLEGRGTGSRSTSRSGRAARRGSRTRDRGAPRGGLSTSAETLAAPAVSGTVRARRGEVKLATGSSSGSSAWTSRSRGAGHRARSTSRGDREGPGLDHGAWIAGPARRPVLTLTSDPPRKQEELLAVARVREGARDAEAAGRARDARGQGLRAATDAWPKAEPSESFWSRLSLGAASEDRPDPRSASPGSCPDPASARGTIVRTEYLSQLLPVGGGRVGPRGQRAAATSSPFHFQ